MRCGWIALVLVAACSDGRPRPFGTLRWVQALPDAPDAPAMALDGNDDLVVGTSSMDNASIRIAKYSGADGSLVWEQVISGVEVAMPHVGVDGNADIVVTGSLMGSAKFGTIALTSDVQVPFVAKLTSAGEVAWATAFTGNSFACGGAISTDRDDNIYAAGDCEGSLAIQGHSIGCEGSFVAAFDATGAARWNVTTQGGPFGDFELPTSADGSVTLVADQMTVHLSSTGDVAWTQPAAAQNVAAIVDVAGELVVATRGTPPKLIATDPTGGLAWWRPSAQTKLTALAALPDGTVAVAGDHAFEAFGPGGELDLLEYGDVQLGDGAVTAIASTRAGGLAFAGSGAFIGILDAP